MCVHASANQNAIAHSLNDVCVRCSLQCCPTRSGDPDCGGQSNNTTELPTIFEYYRKELSRPAEDCIYVLKDVGCPWKASLAPDYGRDYWPLYHSVGAGNLDVWREAKMLLDAFTPTLSLIYLADVDHAGHSGDWDYYTHSIAVADSIVGMKRQHLVVSTKVPDFNHHLC